MTTEVDQREPERRWERSETNKLLTYFSAAIGTTALGIAIWQIVTEPIARGLAETIYVLVLLVLVLFTRVRALETKTASAVADAATLRVRAASNESQELLAQGLLSLVVLVHVPPLADEIHHFSLIREEYVIRGEGGTYNWRFEGWNRSGSVSESLVIKLSGDAPASLDSLGLSIKNANTNTDLSFTVKLDRPHVKVIEICFDPPLVEGAGFAVDVSCKWENIFPHSRATNYVFFPWGAIAPQRVDKYQTRLVSDAPIAAFELRKIQPGQSVAVLPQPLETTSPVWALDWQTPRPEDIYVLTFSRRPIST
ncbi:MAG TPA: hypothetical protein VG318_01090 [Actinomycetota bacterium]|nr:hypothetical protein [Actinomycetota bacterium]